MVMAFRNWSPIALIAFLVFIALYLFWEEYADSHYNFLTRIIDWISDHPVIFAFILLLVIYAVVILVGPERIVSFIADLK